MQVCLYWMVRRIANEWAGTVALALPALIGVVDYSVLARPYAVMLGLAALAIVCWQTAARRKQERTLALVGLALSLALAVNMQYYAVLLYLPLCAAEAVRTVKSKRADIPMLGSIAGGLAGLILVVPFAKALSSFQANHSGVGVGNVHFVTHSYLWLAVGYATLSVDQQHVIGLSCVVLPISAADWFRASARKHWVAFADGRGCLARAINRYSNLCVPACHLCHAFRRRALRTAHHHRLVRYDRNSAYTAIAKPNPGPNSAGDFVHCNRCNRSRARAFGSRERAGIHGLVNNFFRGTANA